MKIHLKEILDSKNISIYSLSKNLGIAPNNLSKLIKGETTSIRFDILESICNYLKVTPNDIFQIEKNSTPEYKALEEKCRFDDTFFNLMKSIATQYNPDIALMNYEDQLNSVVNFLIDTQPKS